MPNTTPLTYNGYVQQIATMAVVNTTTSGSLVVGVDAAFNTIIPQMLNYAELRIQRDLDIMQSQYPNNNYGMTTGLNTVQVSSNDFQTIQTVSYGKGTTLNPILPASKEFIQNVYNDSSYRGPPQYFCPYFGDQSSGGNTWTYLLFGPYPDLPYNLLITGTQWLPTLYTTVGNGLGTTYISTNYPDLLLQASMVYISQFQRNLLPTSNDPQMPGSFEAQYQMLLKPAVELENRKKFRDAAWSSQSQSPVATPTI